MKTILALLLLVMTLSGCPASHRPAVLDKTEPGRLHAAQRAARMPGLGPCNDGAERTLHIDPRQPVTILVHGLNGSTGNFHGLSEALAFQGQQTACFEYDDRDSLMLISSQLVNAIERLAQHLERPEITVIGHSMGGLVARKALIRERPDPVRNVHTDLQLVTVSAPFSGIASARMCAIPVLRVATFGLTDLVCWLICGDSWYEITSASDFIRQPGNLIPQVRRHLVVVTDERGACRHRIETGPCSRDDYVFGLAEQQYPLVTHAARTTIVKVHAGHTEIIGDSDATPHKLLDIFQQEGIVP